jgi:hypothetical protein
LTAGAFDAEEARDMMLSSKRARAIAALVASCGAAAAAVAITAGPAAAAPAAAKPVVIVNCAGKAQVKPSSVVLTCADGGIGLEKLTWVSWKGVAFGSATEYENDCYPYCASGKAKVYTFPVLVTVWGARSRPGHAGQQYFSELTIIHTGSLSRPHLTVPQTETFGLAPNI